MIRKPTRHANGWALVFDQPELDSLRIDPEMPLEITADGQTLIVSPVRAPERRAQFEAALEKVNRRYGGVLNKLAE